MAPLAPAAFAAKRELFSNPLKIRFLTKFIFFWALSIFYFYSNGALYFSSLIPSKPYNFIVSVFPPLSFLRKYNSLTGLVKRSPPFDIASNRVGLFSSYLAGLFEGDGYITVFGALGAGRVRGQ